MSNDYSLEVELQEIIQNSKKNFEGYRELLQSLTREWFEQELEKVKIGNGKIKAHEIIWLLSSTVSNEEYSSTIFSICKVEYLEYLPQKN